ncbi:MAG: inositol monophosphatase [Hyphococcus sp.]|nr:MAG: inositol monophosphatase [Marinicaulis sp.]
MSEEKQLLHMVFGGELESPEECEFRNLDELDIVGVFPNYKAAEKAWRAKAQQTVDNAHMRYFIVHMHKLLDPDGDGKF